MSQITKKTASRLAAVQAIYNYHLTDRSVTIDKLILQIISYYDDNKNIYEDIEMKELNPDMTLEPNKKYLAELVRFTIENIERIDNEIASSLAEGWTMDNLSISLRAILQVGICELLYFPEVPYKVIINEYTNIAAEIAKEQDVGFINSVLDKVASNRPSPAVSQASS